jgi:RHH-type proline utilization regulon transcriptional repressor/proline dehydrogenase/delta 1-pyrroline-5-carboxylate dehydrogenase
VTRPPGCGRPLDAQLKTLLEKPLEALQQWAAGRPELRAVPAVQRAGASGTQRLLPGPTGERNTLTLMPRERVLCVADNEQDALIQLAAVLAVGCEVLWPEAPCIAIWRKAAARSQPHPLCQSGCAADPAFDAVIYHGDSDQLRELCEQVAARDGRLFPCRASPAAKPTCCWSVCT